MASHVVEFFIQAERECQYAVCDDELENTIIDVVDGGSSRWLIPTCFEAADNEPAPVKSWEECIICPGLHISSPRSAMLEKLGMLSEQAKTLISSIDLRKTYAGTGTAEVCALNGVNLDVRAGEFTALMGASGSGKSTLLFLLGGLERASGGEIRFAGDRIDQMNETELSLLRRRSIGFVFQAINLVPHFTLLENLLVPGYLANGDRRSVQEHARELLESLGVGHLADRLPAQASGGEQQRAAIARALINTPCVLFADEPTGALNSSAGTTVLQAFERISREGQSIVMATHEVKAACHADRIIYLRDGEIHAELRLDDCVDVDSQGERAGTDREAQLRAWLSAQGW